MTVVNVPLDATARLELAAMVYARWSTAFNKVKEVKALTWELAGKFCPKAEWPKYKDSMLEAALLELGTAEQLKEQVCKYSPLLEQFK